MIHEKKIPSAQAEGTGSRLRFGLDEEAAREICCEFVITDDENELRTGR